MYRLYAYPIGLFYSVLCVAFFTAETFPPSILNYFPVNLHPEVHLKISSTC